MCTVTPTIYTCGYQRKKFLPCYAWINVYGLLGVKCPYHCIEGTILDDESCLRSSCVWLSDRKRCMNHFAS
ncbi:uncharacterized protein LAJ45_02779 [Morchella importuna]|uniref:uncharacterized protein n=1 Tax=Morchella importuna TaxID=1174673 RepID=UPI001E8D6CC1|nr:uncharacterized protein LAJ45_02779 [Morchella importuna]KAH8153192.1 hypothetical protein LAJ45_02779 [Morchella importuna]